ncbi:MAG: tetratricopeptide repeat protein [Bacteroidales bacterium]|nr:tetratricopeptide repeat protein [Bacteroidales bacterium]
MKRYSIIFILLLMIGLSGFAEGIDSLYYKANVAYNNQYYEDAINNYLKVVDAGYESADLYYNLGNAYFKNDKIPSAILYYEKALKLKPNDEDIRFNLEVANTKIVDKIEPVPELFYKVWWRSFYNLFTANTWAKISSGGFILFIVLLSFYLLSQRIRIRKLAFFTGLVILFFTIFAFGVSYQKYHHLLNKKEAIVFTPTITVKSSPNPNSVDLFVIHEGAKVQLKDKVGDWYEIRIANGSVGWLPVSALQSI